MKLQKVLTSSRKSPTSMLQRHKWGTCVTIVAMRLGCQTPEQVAQRIANIRLTRTKSIIYAHMNKLEKESIIIRKYNYSSQYRLINMDFICKQEIKNQVQKRVLYKHERITKIEIKDKILLTVEEATYSGISEITLRARLREGKYDFILKNGTKTMIKWKTFERYLEHVDAI